MKRKNALWEQRQEDQTGMIAVDTNEAKERDWVKFLTAHCGHVELALAAVAAGAELSKKETKLLGGKPGRRELRDTTRWRC